MALMHQHLNFKLELHRRGSAAAAATTPTTKLGRGSSLGSPYRKIRKMPGHPPGFYLLQASWCIRHWQVCLSECNAYRFRGEVARQGSPQVLACMAADVTAVVAILSTFKQEWFIRSC